MAIEKKWPAVSPQAFTADGGQYGLVTIASAAGFKVKQTVVIQSSILPPISLQVKRVVNSTSLLVGHGSAPLVGPKSQVDLSAYTVAQGAFIYAGEQDKATLTPADIIQSVYRQEPGTTIGVELDDQFGNPISQANPLPVIFDGTVQIGDVSITEGGNTMAVNNDGSINVNVVETPVSGQTVKSFYMQNLIVASGLLTTLITYTVPPGSSAILEKASVSGENIARFDVLLNSNLFDTKRTYWGRFNEDFDYTTGTSNGFALNAGDIVTIQVLHNRPIAGAFNARLQVLEIA